MTLTIDGITNIENLIAVDILVIYIEIILVQEKVNTISENGNLG